MTTFDDREQNFEKKFAHDQERKFLATARRNKLVAGWAAEKLGMTGAAAADYVKAVCKADVSEAGDEDVVRRIHKDLQAKGQNVSDAEIRQKMAESLAMAVAQLDRSD